MSTGTETFSLYGRAYRAIDVRAFSFWLIPAGADAASFTFAPEDMQRIRQFFGAEEVAACAFYQEGPVVAIAVSGVSKNHPTLNTKGYPA